MARVAGWLSERPAGERIGAQRAPVARQLPARSRLRLALPKQPTVFNQRRQQLEHQSRLTSFIVDRINCAVMVPVPTPSAATQDAIQDRLSYVVANLDGVNAQLADASPQQILEWAVDNLPQLYQTTAFGLTGCATLGMVSEISKQRAEANGTETKVCRVPPL